MPPSVSAAFAVVLLIYLAGWGISYHVSRAGFAEWANLGTRFFQLLCGVLLVLTQPILGRRKESALSWQSIQLGFALVLGYVATSCSLLIIHATQDNHLTASAIPPLTLPLTVVASAAEELLFTVFLLSALRHRVSFALAAFLVALTFTLMHAPTSATSFGVRFGYMLAACTLFEKFRSVPAVVGFHILLNTALLVEVLLVRDASSSLVHYQGVVLLVALVAIAVSLLSAYLLIKGMPRSDKEPVIGAQPGSY